MISSFYAAILGAMLIYLSIKTIKARREFGFGIGDGSNIAMQRVVRAQANFTEYAPIFLILLGYAELNHLHPWAVYFLGALFVAGRVMHAHSLLKYEEYNESGKLTAYPKWRVRGMICTFLAIGTLVAVIFFQFVRVFLTALE